MNLGDLSYFAALARTGTMSAAGRALGVKHTTVARRVTALEQQLGSRLFDRLPDGYAMSQAGENLLRHVEKIEEHANDAKREIAGLDAQLQGELKLTAPFDFFCNVVANDFPKFNKQYPCIDLDIICSPGLLDLGALEADIAIRLTESPPDNLVGKPVLPLRHGIYASKHYLEHRPPIDKLVLWRGDSKQPAWVKDHFPKAISVVRTDEARTMATLVKNGMGLARMPCFIGDTEPTLRRLDLALIPSKWRVWILSHTDLRSTARVRVCKEFLINTIEQQHQLITGETSKYA